MDASKCSQPEPCWSRVGTYSISTVLDPDPPTGFCWPNLWSCWKLRDISAACSPSSCKSVQAQQTCNKIIIRKGPIGNSVSDPTVPFCADPDPAFRDNEDPDPSFYFQSVLRVQIRIGNADPDKATIKLTQIKKSRMIFYIIEHKVNFTHLF